jgi:hypothetical protein
MDVLGERGQNRIQFCGEPMTISPPEFTVLEVISMLSRKPMMPTLEPRFVIQAIYGQSHVRVFECIDGKREEVHAFRTQDPITQEKNSEIVKTLCEAMKKAGLIEEGEPVEVRCTPFEDLAA